MGDYNATRALMKYFASASMVLTIVFLPEILTPMVFKLYSKQFHKDVVTAFDQIINEDPYCIIAPRLVETKTETTIYRYREWIVLSDPLEIDAHHVLDHAIRQKLIFYAKEGRSLKQRSEIGSEMHFGVVKEDEFYIWSFKRRSFVKIIISVSEISYLQELKNNYMAFSEYRHSNKFSSDRDFTNYYCSLSYQ